MTVRFAMPALVTLTVALGPLGGAVVGSAAPAAAAQPTVLTVTSTTDSTGSGTACPATATDPCTLRTAVADAVAASTPVDIAFGVTGTITLTGGALQVTGGTVSIDGGPGLITLKGSGDRLFSVSGRGTALTLNHLVLTGGDATQSAGDDGFGGAIDVNTGAALTVRSSQITGNTASNNAGAIDDNTTSAVRIEATTIDHNTSGGVGGAIDTNTGANLTVVNSTITANTAADGGGALNVITGATVALVNDTIAANGAGSPGPTAPGGVLAAANSSLTVTNTVLAGNTAPACAGVVTDGGHNAEDGTTCGFSSHAVSTSAKLGPLQDNGGPTPTMAPAADSPLLAAGDRTVCTTSATGAGSVDQRGVERPQAPTGCDIGAVETVATTTTVAGPSTLTSGGAATLQITVQATTAIAGVPDGGVTVYDGTTALGSAHVTGHSTSSVTFSFTSAALDAGTHSIRAVYAATSLFRGSEGARTLTVSAPSTSTEGSRGPSTTGTSAGGAPSRLAATGFNPVLPLTGGALILLGCSLVVLGRRRRVLT
ncbi:MAG: right-handed parallel beta-helix repeat-containing protein [Frankiales bacterium]|nr:right-handed parallel beta-helix repeat-containing protein [Frankiales bacterium]